MKTHVRLQVSLLAKLPVILTATFLMSMTSLLPSMLPPAQAAEAGSLPASASLGRLFMTPEKREQLDRQRKYDIHDLENMDADTLKVNGVVRRSSGHNSVWINQHMQYGQQKGVRLQAGRSDTVNIDMDNTPPVQVQVGDSVNRSTKERKELLPPNAVRTGKP